MSALRPSTYITAGGLDRLRRDLSARDQAILDFLSRHSYATTSQIQRRYFTAHATRTAATRSTIRVLDRLLRQRLVNRLERKIGGHTRGSAAYIWYLDAAGERLTRREGGPRRRYIDPGLPFLEHSLQVTETVVTLHERAGSNDVEITKLQVEPDAWRSFLTSRGTTSILKPDLFVTLTSTEFDDHWYLEIDRGTESLPVLIQKCRTYAAYKATGQAQAEHGVFPRVLWIVPTQRRVARLTAAIQGDQGLSERIFTVITPDRLVATIRDPETASSPEPRKEERTP
jgi:hypothetical protein